MPDTYQTKADVTEVLIRYATGIDTRDWPLFRACWTENTDADYGPIGRFRGADAVTEFMRTAHEDMGATHHRMSNFVVEVDGDEARARSYVHAVLMVTKDNPEDWMDVIGHYDDELLRSPDGWKIARRTARIARILTNGTVPSLPQ